MVTRTVYVPANYIGRHVLGYIWQRVACSFGDITHVGETLRTTLTMPEREIVKLEKILQKFDLI